jgi:hypothetical protein
LWIKRFTALFMRRGGATLEAYDLNDSLVESVTFNVSGGTFSVEYAGGLHRIYVGYCRDDFDDLTFGDINPVPAPGAVILGSIGLAFSRWKLRRRRKP